MFAWCLGICSNLMIFRILGSLAMSAQFRKTNKKWGNTQIVENWKCLSVIQIYI